MRVQLLETGPSKIQVVKLLRECTGYSLKECSDIVGMVPCSFDVSLDEGVTRRLMSDLQGVGAKLVLAGEESQQPAPTPPPPPPKKPDTPPTAPRLQNTPPPVKRRRQQEHAPEQPSLDWQDAVQQNLPEVEDPVGPSSDLPFVPEVPPLAPGITYDVDFDLSMAEIPAFDFELPDLPSIDSGFIDDIPSLPAIDGAPDNSQRDSRAGSSRPKKEDMKREVKRGDREGTRSREMRGDSPPAAPSSNDRIDSEKLTDAQMARGTAYLKSLQNPVGALIIGILVAAIVTCMWWISAVVDFDLTRFGVILLPIFIAGTIRGSGSAVTPGYGLFSVMLTTVAVCAGLLLRWSLVMGDSDIETGLAIFANTSFEEHMEIIGMHVAHPTSLVLFIFGAIIAFFRGYRRINEKLVRKVWSKIPTHTARRGDSDDVSRVHQNHTTAHGRDRGDSSERDQHRGEREGVRREADTARRTGRYEQRGTDEVSGSVRRSDSDLFSRKEERRRRLADDKERRRKHRDKGRNG
jgi:hypothetical protein